VANYPEAFLFTDKVQVDFSLRVCAKTILVREWTEKNI
jgi:hypothetical protein